MIPFLSLLAGACNVTTTGDRGLATFTPDDCGVAFCSLDSDLAAGASMEVTLGSTGKVSTSGMALASDDLRVAVVFPLTFDRWLVTGVGPGAARLAVIDRGHEVDSTFMTVQRPARFALYLEDGPAVERAPEHAGEQVFAVPAGAYLSFRVRPYDFSGDELMGKLNLDTELDADLFHSLAPTADLPAGKLAFQSMLPGEHWMSVASQGVLLDVFFDAN